MLTVGEARDAVLRAARVLPPEEVPCAEAPGRILQEEIRAPHDFPAWDKAMMDGYAVVAADLAAVPRRLRVIQEVPAGTDPGLLKRVEPGGAARIMTGGPVPPGADAVLIVEETAPVEGTPDQILAIAAVRAGDNIARRGDDQRAGDTLLAAGDFIGPGEIGVLASVGRTRVRVGGRPRVAVLATGDELVEPEQTPAPGGIRNSNGPLVMALLRQAGCAARYLGIAPDKEDALADLIRSGLEADALILSGGVSMGVYDLVGKTLRSLGTDLHFDRVAIKPGRPFTFGTRGGTLVFGCPGNPVSTYVIFHVFIRPALRKMAGFAAPVRSPRRGTLKGAVRQRPGRTGYCQARAAWTGAGYEVDVLPTTGSADFVSCARGNALAILPATVDRLDAGTVVDFLPLEDFDDR